MNTLKRLSLGLLASSVLFCVGCSVGDRYDGKIVKDKDGNIYQLKHNIGDTYFVKPCDTNQLRTNF